MAMSGTGWLQEGVEPMLDLGVCIPAAFSLWIVEIKYNTKYLFLLISLQKIPFVSAVHLFAFLS